MNRPPQCWSQKKHGPHTWGEFEPDPRAPFDCLGLDEGVRFIDKFKKVWICVHVLNYWDFPCTEGAVSDSTYEDEDHSKCGFRWTAILDVDDMARLARAFDMSRADTTEFLEL